MKQYLWLKYTPFGLSYYFVSVNRSKFDKILKKSSESIKIRNQTVYLASYLGLIEILIFTGTTYLSLHTAKFDIAKFFNLNYLAPAGAVLAGWMTLKLVGNYQGWINDTEGRPRYYIFLIGTFINLVVSVLAGLGLGYGIHVASLRLLFIGTILVLIINQKVIFRSLETGKL